MMQHALTVVSALAKGLVRFGLDRLGVVGAADEKDASSGLPVEACHPYGLRSRPRDPDVDAAGNPTKGAGLLLLDFGGGDEGGIPTQDPRVALPDEGKGGCQIYAWTGSGVSYVLISGDTGSITLKVGAGSILLDGATDVGGTGGAAIARAPELQSRAAAQDAFNAAVSSALTGLGAPAPPAVPPLASSVAATKGKVV